MTAPSPRVLDAPAVWAGLSAHEQRELGVVALVAGLSILRLQSVPEVGLSGCDLQLDDRLNTAVGESMECLADLVSDHVDPLGSGTDLLPDLNQIDIRSCRACGCTDRYGCAEGCGWSAHDPLLCTSCEAANSEAPR